MKNMLWSAAALRSAVSFLRTRGFPGLLDVLFPMMRHNGFQWGYCFLCESTELAGSLQLFLNVFLQGKVVQGFLFGKVLELCLVFCEQLGGSTSKH